MQGTLRNAPTITQHLKEMCKRLKRLLVECMWFHLKAVWIASEVAARFIWIFRGIYRSDWVVRRILLSKLSMFLARFVEELQMSWSLKFEVWSVSWIIVYVHILNFRVFCKPLVTYLWWHCEWLQWTWKGSRCIQSLLRNNFRLCLLTW
jgi:hypothetical protein